MRLISGNVVLDYIASPHVLVFYLLFSLLVQQGIGNTAQGAANCIMFVFCTRPIRTRLCATLCCCSKGRPGASNSQDAPNRLPVGQDPSTKRDQIVRWCWTQKVWNITSWRHMRGEFCIMTNRDDAFWMYCWVIHTGNTAGKGLHVGYLYLQGGRGVLLRMDCLRSCAAKIGTSLFTLSTNLGKVVGQ